MAGIPWLALWTGLVSATPASGGGGQWLEAIAASEFEFQRADINLPSLPFSWVTYTRYGESELTSDRPELDGLTFEQQAFSHALFAPLVIRPRDMLLAGYYLGTEDLEFDRAPFADGDLHTIGVGAAWLHQVRPKWMTGVFAAPLVHSSLGGGDPWEVEWFTGALVRYYVQPTVQWLFGGVYQQGFDSWFVYPYLGAVWSPHPDWSINAILPWPSVSYAVNRGWMVRGGAAPSGGQWRAADRDEFSIDFGGWDLGLITEVNAVGRVWLFGAGGWSGFRGLGFNEDGDTVEDTDLDSEPFVRLGLSLRL